MTWTIIKMIPKYRLLLCTACFAANAFAAGAETLTEALKACREISDDGDRLACYDEKSAALVLATSDQKAEAPAVAPVEEFGARGTAVARAQEQEKVKEPEIESITAVVTSISTRARGERVFVLDNGQTWVEKEAARYFPVKVGDKVGIEVGALRSFRLQHPSSGRSTKVTRLE